MFAIRAPSLHFTNVCLQVFVVFTILADIAVEESPLELMEKEMILKHGRLVEQMILPHVLHVSVHVRVTWGYKMKEMLRRHGSPTLRGQWILSAINFGEIIVVAVHSLSHWVVAKR